MANVEKYHIDKIYLAIPSASAEETRDILNICSETDCQLKQLPGMYQFVTGEVTVGAMRDVSVEDLLGREPIKTKLDEVYKFISGKTILVTGGGGSIGSELCRQIAGHNPKQLIIFDIYENNAYDIQLELKDTYPELDLVTLIGSVRDSRRLDEVFSEYRPDVVYHAAAHKHVPLMEDNPCESIKNNVVGTYKTAYAAMLHGCKRFVLISTDKAVNPTNIMGASKRLCEMVIQSLDRKVREGKVGELPVLYTHASEDDGCIRMYEKTSRDAQTEFVAVRFGNVLGSNGSVIPLFKRQIEKGGPVTVTHPDIIRYFMTIPEAVSLVLQAGTYARGGEIFVLDMGSPVKIDTLARNLIKLSGLKPDVDIQIEYTGLRPGEKLYEEKLMAEEGMKKTDNELIHIGSPIPFDTDEFLGQLNDLMDAAYANDKNIRDFVQRIVPTYHPEKAQKEAGGDATYKALAQEAESHEADDEDDVEKSVAVTAVG
jgi:FlaA1/EpsC-like NDP-sugar epimerase